MARTFAALAEYNYRLYFTGALVSNIGTWMQRVAQDWLVLELSGGSAFAVGVTTALQFAPALVLAPYAGLIADRFYKRSILRLTQLGMAACAVVLGVLAIGGVAETWHVFALAGLFGVASAIDAPARQAFVSEMVPSRLVPNAVGLNSASFNMGRLIGPGVAGLVIATWGSGWAILTNGVTYFAFLAALTMIDTARLRPVDKVPRERGQVRAGLNYVRNRAELLVIFGVAFSVGTFAMNFQISNALMAQQEFFKSAEEYGILGSVMAIGSLLGALTAARRTAATRVRVIVILGLAIGVYTMILGFMPSYTTYLIALPVAGLLTISVLTSCNATVQLGSSPALRGRVMALYAMVLMGGTPIGAPLLGAIAQAWGPRWILWAGGGLTIVSIAVTVLLVSRAKHLTFDASWHPLHVDVHGHGEH